MTFCFSISWASKEKDSLSSWGKLSQLIECQRSSFGLQNSVSCGLSKSQSADSKTLRKVQKSNIVSNSADNGYNSGIEFSFSFRNSSTITSKMLDYS